MLTTNEYQKLTAILAGVYEFTDGGARDRRVLMTQAGLSRFLSGINLSGAPRMVAGDLIGRLKDFGQLPERPVYHALGALLSYMLMIPELSPDDTAYMAELVVKYNLVSDPAYIDGLRTQYEITEAPVREADLQVPVPKGIVSAISAPDFEVAIKSEDEMKGLEQIINDETNFLDIYLLYGALYSAKAVCLIERPEGQPIGTGFLVGPDLVLTNHHVLEGANQVQGAVARFDRMIDAANVTQPGRTFSMVPNFYFGSPPKELDYALVKLTDRPLKDITVDPGDDLTMIDLFLQGKHRGYLPLVSRLIVERERVNIVQHPNCDPMKVVMTQNYVVEDMTPTRVQYVADTMDGSSGSPVFNRKWEVVAIHHSGKPYPPESAEETKKKAWKGILRVNEGVPMRAILDDFDKKGILRYLPRS